MGIGMRGGAALGSGSQCEIEWFRRSKAFVTAAVTYPIRIVLHHLDAIGPDQKLPGGDGFLDGFEVTEVSVVGFGRIHVTVIYQS